MLSKSERRRQEILSYLKNHGRLSIQETMEHFHISEATARRDLDTLSSHPGVVRTIGGAQYKLAEPSFMEKKDVLWKEKEAIAEKAVELVKEGDVVGLSGGTTTYLIARALKQKTHITVVTNAVNIAMELADTPSIQIVLTGGVMRSNSYELCGPLAEKTVSGLNIGKMFIGLNGLSIEQGLTTYSEQEAAIGRLLIEQSAEVIAVFDQTKLGRTSLFPICSLDQIHACITDADIDITYEQYMKKHHIQLHRAAKAGSKILIEESER